MTLYFDGAVDSNWATLGNWWTDAAHTIQAAALPTVNDDVQIDSNLYTLGGVDRTVASVVVSSEVSLGNDPPSHTNKLTANLFTFQNGYLNMTVVGTCVFNGYSNMGGGETALVIGACTFNDTSTPYGPVQGGPVVFNDDCVNNSNLIVADCTFNDDSKNEASITITGDCVFNDASKNYGGCTGNCTFNGTSQNLADGNVGNFILGTCTFNDASVNSSDGGVAGPLCVFNDSSTNTAFGWISSPITEFRGTSCNQGSTGFAFYFYDNSYMELAEEGPPFAATSYIRQHPAAFLVWRDLATSTYITNLVFQFPEMDVIGAGML